MSTTMMLNPDDVTSALFDTMSHKQIEHAVKRFNQHKLADDLVALVGLRHEKGGKRYIDAHSAGIMRMLTCTTYSILAKDRSTLSQSARSGSV